MFEEMDRFNEEMVKAGVMLAGEGLHPTSKGARVTFSGGKTDFAALDPTGELLAKEVVLREQMAANSKTQ